jgi:uncharacterized OB-fold protein
MTIQASYLGMPVELADRETDNVEYFGHCARGDFHLQCCAACALLRYPPSPSCPWCAHAVAHWKAVPGLGTVHSYMEVQHAVQPAFRAHTPFLILLVELDVQRGLPNAGDALRMIGNLTTPDGVLAAPAIARTVGIGSRVRMVFTPIAPGLALPQWTLDETAIQPARPWRYPEPDPGLAPPPGAGQ